MACDVWASQGTDARSDNNSVIAKDPWMMFDSTGTTNFPRLPGKLSTQN